MKRRYKIIFIPILVLVFLILILDFSSPRTANPVWGVSFSILHARALGFDSQKMYLDILNELRPKRLRLMAYWEVLEPERGRFDFADFDYLLGEAQARGIEVILALGQKLPRWPECHHPVWYDKLSAPQQEEATLAMLGAAINHFKDFGAITAWQIENEPFFPYGPECYGISRELYQKELDLVKSLDARPIVVTDSGEKGAWLPTAWAGGDIFGSTMYRKVYHHKKTKYIAYRIPPVLYRMKAGMVRIFSSVNQFIGVELQAEPWFVTDALSTDWKRQEELMNPKIFLDNMEYARRVGFAENYFWGVEWWYWAKSQGHPEMWEEGKKVINNYNL